ncbi:glutamine--fructose-6-phosphate transaminase (isomerizing) [Conexibacter sp. CPCC 206217]|uniref:glutamine--fructose-6-phosphate transaminase (isomerizing) n=1 Tax=Conexibacter sp. CPCC 206217 TaxID=3064574 RepID=UPI0027205574|nr:glutamine--fructose-6-phosphate transaminase (isomerizing) [Conexibacter sp. CPCC 206217]MDO8209683.1 glutamine--fructose-6-phosphate transaminase (isomerizing) [Conexibacter sp. CPCC 206217]
MCGIVGYVGNRPCIDLLLDGLERLEYRGYDSAGVALLDDDAALALRVRSVGGIAELRGAVARHPDAEALQASRTGIGHTRWATHGRVSEGNAHPLSDDGERVQIVLNGIVENHVALRSQLRRDGAVFSSETDAEVVAHLVAGALDRGLAEAVRHAIAQLDGHFAFVATSPQEPGVLVGTRRACPLVVGYGDEERFLGSALVGLPDDLRGAHALDDDTVVVARADGLQVLDARGGIVQPRQLLLADAGAHARPSRNGHDSFMLAEIEEQPQALRRTLRAQAAAGWDVGPLARARRVSLIACGTSYHAGLVGRYLLETWGGVRAETDVASEWRHRDPDVGPGDVVLGITQSGETADTLGALRVARERGAHVLGLTNASGSQITREADATVLTDAGPEVSVAATKTFVTQVAALAGLSLRVGLARGTLTPSRAALLLDELERLPDVVEAARAASAAPIERAVERWSDEGFFLFLGRHVGLPVALEGALKLKEVAYVPSDAYAAGEMKHGPIALLREGTPVVVVATDSPVLDKLRSNVAEVRARGAHVLAIATEGAAGVIADEADELVLVPPTDPLLSPVPATVPLQLLAYGIARARGLDPDRPRNLAKTVTVE